MSTDLPAGAARTPPVERRRTFQVAELSDLSAERQRRHVALDGRWPWIDPIWHEVVLARSPVGHGQAECALLSITRYCPHLRLIRVATFSPPGVTFESVDPTQLAGGLARALCRDCSLRERMRLDVYRTQSNATPAQPRIQFRSQPADTVLGNSSRHKGRIHDHEQRVSDTRISTYGSSAKTPEVANARGTTVGNDRFHPGSARCAHHAARPA